MTNRRETFRDLIKTALLTIYESSNIVNTYNQSVNGEEIFIQIGNDNLIESSDNEGFENSFEVRECSFTISYRTILKTTKDSGLYQRNALFEALENIEQSLLTLEPQTFQITRSGDYIYNVFITNIYITDSVAFMIEGAESLIEGKIRYEFAKL